MLLTFIVFDKSAMETNSNSIFVHKTRARAAFFGSCARTCLRSAHARGGCQGGLGKRDTLSFCTLAGTFVYLFSRILVSNKNKILTEHVCQYGARGWFLLRHVCRQSKKMGKCASTAQMHTDCMGAPTMERHEKYRFHDLFSLKGESEI